MSKASSLTKNPTLMTALLSAVTLIGYAAYRLAIPDPESNSQLANSLPEFILDDLAGTPTPLDTWVNEAMLVNFWATWCAPCLREIPLLKTFHAEHESIEVVGIAVDRAEPVRDYANEMRFNYPVLVGQSNAYEAMAVFRNEAQVMPFSAFTAPGGAVLGVHYGELHPEHLEAFAETIELLETGTIDLEQARKRLATPL